MSLKVRYYDHCISFGYATADFDLFQCSLGFDYSVVFASQTVCDYEGCFVETIHMCCVHVVVCIAALPVVV